MTLQLLFPERKIDIIVRGAIRKNLEKNRKQFQKELPLFLSVKELASFLKINVKTVYQSINKGEIPANKISGVIRIHRDTLITWFSSCHGGKSGQEK